MSVRKGDRTEGKLQVLNKARILKSYSIDRAKTFPKSTRWLYAAPVVREKAALAELDYKTIKVAEGVAEADTLEDVIPVKNRLREEIDANRAIYRDRLAQIKAIEEEMLGGKSEQTVFEACCERDNESFSAFEAWICGNAEQNA